MQFQVLPHWRVLSWVEWRWEKQTIGKMVQHPTRTRRTNCIFGVLCQLHERCFEQPWAWSWLQPVFRHESARGWHGPSRVHFEQSWSCKSCGWKLYPKGNQESSSRCSWLRAGLAILCGMLSRLLPHFRDQAGERGIQKKTQNPLLSKQELQPETNESCCIAGNREMDVGLAQGERWRYLAILDARFSICWFQKVKTQNLQSGNYVSKLIYEAATT